MLWLELGPNTCQSFNLILVSPEDHTEVSNITDFVCLIKHVCRYYIHCYTVIIDSLANFYGP